jgi:hypothetical protein
MHVMCHIVEGRIRAYLPTVMIRASYMLDCLIIYRFTHHCKYIFGKKWFTLTCSCEWNGNPFVDHLQTAAPTIFVHGLLTPGSWHRECVLYLECVPFVHDL